MTPPAPVEGAAWIPLSDRTWALVSDEDADRVSAYSWKTLPSGHVRCNAVGMLHRFVLGLRATDPEVDHANGDPRDNRRCNLRLATSREQKRNTRRRRDGFKGVSVDKRSGRWAAYITIDYRRRTIGWFATEVEAACAYDEAARGTFGAFACLNFPREGERAA